MKFRNIAALLALSTTLSACVSGSDDTVTNQKPTAGFQAQFNPDFGILPFPNDLYSGSNGQLAIPGDAKVAANGPILELNHLDGFGTQSDIDVYFTSSIDPKSISGSDVILLKVASSIANKKAVDPTGTATKLKFGVDYTAVVSPGSDTDGTVLTIKPLHPLDPSKIDPATSTPTLSTYMVVVTSGLKDTGGAAATASAEFSKVIAADLPALQGGKMGTTGDPTLDQVALFTLPQLAVAAGGLKIPLNDIAVTFSFSTGFLKVALTAVAATAAPTTQPAGVGIIDTHLTVCKALFKAHQLPDEDPTHCEAAVPGSTFTEVFAGTVALPYYLTVPAKGSTAALTDSWHNAKGGDIALSATDNTSFVPKPTTTSNVIPILVAMPLACGAAPAGGWPVTIFQHGITRNREDMLGIASSLSVGGHSSGLCTAVLAIDLPLHGVTDTSDPFYTKGFERTFDMDATGHAGAAAADIAGSGTLFINLSSTITSRDNLREGAADLLNLVASLPNIHPGGATLDGTKVFFVGHSLGAIVGTNFLAANAAGVALNPTQTLVSAGVLAMPGGHIAKLLTDSPSFSTQINQGLADKGLATGTQSYYDFLSQAQAVVEDGDPANYAADAAAGVPIHMIEVVGGHDASSPPDQVVPNSATDVLIAQMQITTPISAVGTVNPISAGLGNSTLAQFTTGDHGSILDPTVPDNTPDGTDAAVKAEYGAVTVEMQTEATSVVFDILAGVPLVTIADNTFLTTTLKK